MRRPRYKHLFDRDRTLRIFFYTSNLEKISQAQLIFGRHGYRLSHFTSHREPYDEDYSGGTKQLLARAIEQVSGAFGVRSCFFVEDTSLRIESLSEKADFPGVRVKEWFSRITFEEFDEQLKVAGGDRAVTVKSDIALRIPGLRDVLFFHGEANGSVASHGPTYEPNPVYPWLTPSTFNGWFVPEGADKTLGEMPLDESLKYDFRAKALTQLIDRIAEYNAIANLPQSHFQVRSRRTDAQDELPLFTSSYRTIVFIGPSCAGKTTAGDILRRKFGFPVLEASSVLREVAEVAGSEIKDSKDAMSFLSEHGFATVGERLVQLIKASDDEVTVITGLRTIEEIDFLTRNLPEVLVVNVEAEARKRYLRHIERGRDQDPRTFTEFEARDDEQAAFGLLRVARPIADVTVVNEGDLSAYESRILGLAAVRGLELTKRSEEPDLKVDENRSELLRSLFALARIGRFANCEEISNETTRDGARVRKYNTNRALKLVPDLATRQSKKGDVLRYRITDRGLMFLDLFKSRQSAKKGARAPARGS